MIITEFDREDVVMRDQLADLLKKTWPEEYREESQINALLAEERLAVAALEEDMLIGFIGAIPQYDHTGWELHPLVVGDAYRRRKIGMRLVDFLEKEVASHGGITMYLGTDDENHATSLSELDLYQDTFQALSQIENLKNHPFEFYEKQGYQIVGVIPDANGWNKPDILMAKRIAEPENENSPS